MGKIKRKHEKIHNFKLKPDDLRGAICIFTKHLRLKAKEDGDFKVPFFDFSKMSRKHLTGAYGWCVHEARKRGIL